MDPIPQKKQSVSSLKCITDIRIPCHSEFHARCLQQALSVEKELTHQTERFFNVDGNYLTVEVRASDARMLRKSVTSTMDSIHLGVQIVEAFS
ncbi:CTAG/Pcc1 family like protein [Aduncisulcus paluster]|uniref:CTAG/Pcc1 family like protein n=1 Tax=Aduncisulcus paluster TaxID=2918883 RepID=A0ABQ5K345_9EUKA|nr:CTAG/Pcc1 family like protein [Aduncisulcus paluster]